MLFSKDFCHRSKEGMVKIPQAVCAAGKWLNGTGTVLQFSNF